MKKAIKILVLVILGAIALIPGIACFESESATWVKVLNSLDLMFEALIVFSLAMINWWPEDNQSE